MKKFTAVFITIFLVLFFAALPHVSEGSSSKTRQITGNVSNVDTDNSTVTVKKKGMEVTLNMDSKTKVSECTNSATIDNIKTGDKATASYKETEDMNTARSITVTK
jgi:Cu/Ag efflux protein CusF